MVPDGKDRAVEALVRELGLKHARARPAPSADNGAAKVAAAYKWALSHAFDFLTRDEALVVVEDDLLFAPDLMEWFLFGWSAMRADASLWCVSAWHDNGLSGLVREPKKVLRTEYFPGLGWLLSRKLYKEELEEKWPNEHWDHWMRSETVFKTSRAASASCRGAAHLPQRQRRHLHGPGAPRPLLRRHCAQHRRRRRWPPAEWPALVADAVAPAAYEASSAPRSAPPRRAPTATAVLRRRRRQRHGGARALVLAEAARHDRELFDAIAEFVGIWHEMCRGAHKGVHELWCGGRRLYLVNTRWAADAAVAVQGPRAEEGGDLATADAFAIAVRRFEAKHAAARGATAGQYVIREHAGV